MEIPLSRDDVSTMFVNHCSAIIYKSNKKSVFIIQDIVKNLHQNLINNSTKNLFLKKKLFIP